MLEQDVPLLWGKHPLPRSRGTEHFLIVGASGSGKTTLINRLMKSVFKFNDSFCALVYDPKQDVLPMLYALRQETESNVENGMASVRVLHPLDDRCCSWNLPADIDGPVSARQLATILVPDQEDRGSGNSFFTSAVRDLLTGILLVFINCTKKDAKWTFRDVLLAMLYEPYLWFLMSIETTRDGEIFPVVKRLKESYLEGDDKRTISNIRATINSKISIYEPIAATWHLAEKKGAKFTFSLKDWADGKYSDVLVLGNDEASRAAIDAINQAIFKRATEMVLARHELERDVQDRGENQIWFFLDEVREAGQLDGLSRLLTKGRSKGACIVMGFQDISGMRDEYGEEVANEICGQCNNVAILKLNSPTTAQWASELFGKRLATQRGKGTSFDSAGKLQESRNLGEEERPYLYTSDFLYLPKTNEQNGLSGLFRGLDTNPETDPLLLHFDWQKDIEPERVKIPKAQPKVLEESEKAEEISESWLVARRPIHPSKHYLKPWDQEDWERLGLDKITPNVIDWKSVPKTEEAPGKDKKNMPRGSKNRLSQFMDGWLPGNSDRNQEN
ncbi:type IV secretion system DNA-binding domain-containing protein [Armatimonas sp.]|uniref:type IV secretory system conjugative DNA transfer family protein n=1 Tax=Armatimonas sp. TaxID=1872638 RepID=UPI00286C1340|nr:type IV secretion system DNA-binding domain-containing protein [Armatimonas sp.]